MMMTTKNINAEEETEYYPVARSSGSVTPTSTKANSEEWPQTPCLIKNTFLHFAPNQNGDGEQQQQHHDHEIEVLKGKVSRPRARSEPPSPNARDKGPRVGADPEDVSGNDFDWAMTRALTERAITADEATQEEVESRVATLQLDLPEWRMTTLDLAELDIGATMHGVYGTEWEARMAMNNVDLSIDTGATDFQMRNSFPQQFTVDCQAAADFYAQQQAQQRSTALEGAMWIQQALAEVRTPEPGSLLPGGYEMPQRQPSPMLPEPPAMTSGSFQEPPVQTQLQVPQPQQPQHQIEDKEATSRAPKEDPMPWETGVVTVMIRQVPRRYSSQMQLLEKISARGFTGVINFLYLPFDMKKGVNVGYCFVGFTEHCHALRFRDVFDGSFLDKNSQVKDKPLRVHPASVQGYQASCEHFARTKTGQKQDRRFSPLFLGPDGRTPPAQALANSRLPHEAAEAELYNLSQMETHLGEMPMQQQQQQQEVIGASTTNNSITMSRRGQQQQLQQQNWSQGPAASWSSQATWAQHWEEPGHGSCQAWGAR